MKIAIVGAGKLGLSIADMLIGGDHSVTIIDKDSEVIERFIAPLDVMGVTGNGKEVVLLNDIGIGGYDYLIAVTDRDEKNIVISSIAKRLGVGKVIARIRDPEHLAQREFLQENFNIDHVLNPDLAVAEEINKYLVEKYTLSNGVLYAGMVSMLEFEVGKIPSLVGKTCGEAAKHLGEVVIAAVSRNGKVIIPRKDDSSLIDADDWVYVVGKRDIIEGISKKVFESGRYTDIQKVMIAGGGKAGFYLAKMLEEFGASVKIIDISMKRCQYLSTHLGNVLVLHGDATDPNLLHDENFEDMDAFVSTTGFDEENLLLALMAKKAGIEDVIAKISRDSFGSLIESMGVDMALNPVDITASHVSRLLQGTKVLSSQMIQGQAELIQVAVEDDMALTGRTIASMRIPDGMMIAAIQRRREVIMPDGDTAIEGGDRIVIVSQLTEAFDLEKLLKTKRGLLG
ncbi:MAG: Trk system potassium transporter TrkA [Clostridiales Family XIII bacterium]|jgi:trk system potassium uptake protein TrkA|nr:Trk system potassium transporter TrkA [Clostridiales Family XIII bacterium]